MTWFVLRGSSVSALPGHDGASLCNKFNYEPPTNHAYESWSYDLVSSDGGALRAIAWAAKVENNS